MIPRDYRLTVSSSSPFVGSKQYGRWCLVILNQANSPKWAITVSKKIDNRAVIRNRLRRQISQWLYIHLSELKPQQFLVILRRKPTNKEDLKLLFDELKKYV